MESLLVVENEPGMLDLLAGEARLRGYAVATAGSLPEAVAVADRQRFDAALVDLMLDGDSGLDLIRRLKQWNPGGEIVVASGATSLASALEAYELGVFALVPKPFEMDHLFATVGRALARRRLAVEQVALYDRVTKAKSEWERTFDAISDPIGVFSAEGRLVRANAALAAHCGWPLTGVQGRPCDAVGLCGDATGQDCAVRRAVRDRTVVQATVVTAGGEIFAVTTLPVEGGGENISVVQVAKNVTEERRSAERLREMSEALARSNATLRETLTELKTTQAQLVQSEKLSAIGQLVAGVAHELNNPLTSVIGYAQLVHDALGERAGTRRQVALPTAEEVRRDIQRIVEEAERAARIVRNLLAFARGQSGDRALQPIAELFERVLSLRAYDLRLSNVVLETEFAPDLPPVHGDANQIQQVLLNLVLNAEQAVKDKAGARRVRAGARFEPATRSVVAFLADNGHGIDQADLSRVFDPFFTTRPLGEGTGLGLSICYGIVRDHGGEIWAESAPGAGATFFVRLPARPPAGSANPPITALVAHPEPGPREFLRAALTGWGLVVTAAATPREALRAMRPGPLDAALVEQELRDAEAAAWRAARADGSVGRLLILGGPSPGPSVDGSGTDDQGDRIIVPPFRLGPLHDVLRQLLEEDS